MAKFTTRLPLDIKTGDPQNSHVPIYDEARGVWNTIPSSSLLTSTVSASYALTASFVAGNVLSSSFATTASYVAGNVLSSSFAITASYVAGNVLSASYAVTSSYAESAKVFPFTGSAIISGSLRNTGSFGVSGSTTLGGNTTVIGDLTINNTLSPELKFTNGDAFLRYGSGEFRLGTAASALISFYVNGGTAWYIDTNRHLLPNFNNTMDIGLSSQRVKTIYTTNIISTNPISSSISASYAATASFVSGVIPSSSYALTSSFSTTASYVS
jgi:hypothetical protein